MVGPRGGGGGGFFRYFVAIRRSEIFRTSVVAFVVFCFVLIPSGNRRGEWCVCVGGGGGGGGGRGDVRFFYNSGADIERQFPPPILIFTFSTSLIWRPSRGSTSHGN